MGKMNQIQLEITDMLENGSTFEAMVEHLQVAYSFPYETAENWVLDIEADAIMREEREYHNDSDDSDDGYALASAGFGTDEDYGSYSDIEEY
jgi:hypothetical protein